MSTTCAQGTSFFFSVEAKRRCARWVGWSFSVSILCWAREAQSTLSIESTLHKNTGSSRGARGKSFSSAQDLGCNESNSNVGHHHLNTPTLSWMLKLSCCLRAGTFEGTRKKKKKEKLFRHSRQFQLMCSLNPCSQQDNFNSCKLETNGRKDACSLDGFDRQSGS